MSTDRRPEVKIRLIAIGLFVASALGAPALACARRQFAILLRPGECRERRRRVCGDRVRQAVAERGRRTRLVT